MDVEAVQLAMSVLATASRVIEQIQDGMARRGFPDVRPAHGFAFVRISHGDATVLDVAEHLGVTKQAASQLVEQLVQRGYVTRVPDPADARRRTLALTARGRACTRAAEASAADAVRGWQDEIGADGVRRLTRLLARVSPDGPLRPAW
ncbi:MAG TPA: MarR family winged helix-turn-helix transcriptional regulator [Jatrophihabitantaceae bacterium]|jgi:DNA-binding MarR family transcriptional regulator|nr:MarR family winged helix-turn-helix transcriptional regulator [Jatrophihabitantaceae bacterium]